MFKNRRCLSKGVQDNIGFELQLLMWSMIDNCRGKIELDYLQVFELSIVEENGRIVQRVVHSQEEPVYKEEGFYKIQEPVNAEVWVMDSDEYCVMLFPEEN